MLRLFCEKLFNIKKNLLPITQFKVERSTTTTNQMDNEAERIIWMDLEMTGLDVNKDHILEIACIITDSKLNIIAEGPELIINQPLEILNSMGEWCTKQHGKTGLIEASKQSDITIQQAGSIMMNFFHLHLQPGVSPLAGSSVYMDKLFIMKHLPNVAEYMHYRIIDVSSIKELCRRWNPSIYSKAPQKQFLHRALSDIKESIQELKWYKEHFLNTTGKMVLFGELVIPSSRALWDDDFDYSQNENISCLEWKGDSSVPANISNILIIETPKLNNIAISCLENESKPLCHLADTNFKIYKLKYNNYLILCSEEKNSTPGEVIEMIIPWLQNSERVVCITSNSTAMFQKSKSEEMPSCFIKSLSIKPENSTFAPVLDVPNLITGFCAGAISYCHHVNKTALLYVCYTDPRPLDSLTAAPILELLKMLNIPTDKPFSFRPEFISDSNLYM